MSIASLRYRAGLLPPHEELQLWRSSLSALFDVEVEHEETFRLSLDGWNLGSVVLGPIETVAQRYKRSRRKIVTSGVDHYLLQLYLGGGYRSVNGRRDLLVKPGDIALLDLAQPVDTHASEAKLFNVLMPRVVLEQAMPHGAPEGGLVIAGDTTPGGLLRDYFASLEQRLPSMKQHEVTSVLDATVGLIAACLAPTVGAMERAAPGLEETLLWRMKRHIALHLYTRRVSPEALCDEFHLSRASLYRLFAPENGVAAYVRRLKLERCARDLIDPSLSHCSIHELAARHGFDSPAHFQRLFRRHYGLPPGQLRDHVLHDGAAPERSEAAELEAWIRSLGGASG